MAEKESDSGPGAGEAPTELKVKRKSDGKIFVVIIDDNGDLDADEQ